MKKLIMGIIAGTCAISLIGCNTMKGAGQDVENTGKNIKQTVEKND